MKKTIFSLLFAVTTWFVSGQNLNRIEYFIDTDPGYGIATSVTFTAAAAVNDLTFSVPITSAADGFHTLFLRSRDVNNKWSLVQARAFYKVSSLALAAPANLSRIEYFVDTDPGYGLGTSVAFTAGAAVTDLAFTVPLTSVADGFHTLFVRTKDANNLWSVVQARAFYKVSSSALAAPANLNRIEYFVDTDPGFGLGTSVVFTAGASVTDLAFTVPLTSVTDGFHTLFVRTKDANNLWSVVQARAFYKVPASALAPAPNLSSIEYFVDTDPGYGLATSVPFTAGNSVTDLVFSVDVSTVTVGAHKLYVRSKDANNKWSMIQVRDFNICNQAIPVTSAATAITTIGFTANWAAATGATGYRLDVSADNFATFVTGYNDKDVGNVTILAVTGLTTNTPYKYRVRAVGTCASVNSAAIDVNTAIVAPAAPVAAAATAISATGFTANWAAVAGATGYQLDVSVDNFATFITGYNAKTLTGIAEAVAGLTANTAYKYRVRATNGGGASVSSSQISVTTLTLAPVATAATAITTIGFTANWATVVGATSYRLDVSADNFATFITGFSDKTVTTLNNAATGLTANTAYKYRVRAVNATGTSVNSNVIDVTTLSAGPSAPAASAATSIASTGFTANWAAVTGATSYKLDVSADNFATFVTGFNDKTVTILSDAVSGLTASTAYKYRVRAVSANGTSVNSNVVDVTTTAATAVPPAPVASAASSIAATGFTANWTAVTGATSYKLDVSADNFATFVTGFNDKTVTILSDAVSGLTASTAYKYRVRAVNANGTSANSNVIDVTTTAAGVKQDQTITFGTVSSKTLGDAPFTIGATASSGLTVSYATASDKITIVNGVATIVKAGTESIEASQPGNATFNAAVTLKQSFCINPAKPNITSSNANTETPTLTSSSSSGNQWYKDGTAISGATNTTLTVTGVGVYSVESTVETCKSVRSTNFPIIITGDITSFNNRVLEISPNPTSDYVTLKLPGEGKKEIGIFNPSGSMQEVKSTDQNQVTVDVRQYAAGYYLVRVSTASEIYYGKFIRK